MFHFIITQRYQSLPTLSFISFPLLAHAKHSFCLTLLRRKQFSNEIHLSYFFLCVRPLYLSLTLVLTHTHPESSLCRFFYTHRQKFIFSWQKQKLRNFSLLSSSRLPHTQLVVLLLCREYAHNVYLSVIAHFFSGGEWKKKKKKIILLFFTVCDVKYKKKVQLAPLQKH